MLKPIRRRRDTQGRSVIGRGIACAAALLAFVAGSAGAPPPVYRFVMNRYGTPSQLEVYEVDRDGSLSWIQSSPTGGGWLFEMDPFGRFLVHPNGSQGNARLDVYAIGADGKLTFAGGEERANWVFFSREHTLTPDGKYYLTLSKQVSPEIFYFEVFRINEDLSIESVGRVENYPDNPLGGPPGFDGRAGSAMVGSSYLLFQSSRISGISTITVYPVTASGEIQAPTQQFSWNAQPINGGWAIRQDQRIMVTGNWLDIRLPSFAIDGAGRLTPVGWWDYPTLGPWAGEGIRFHPSGLALVTGIVVSLAPISRAGTYTEPALFFDELGVTDDADPAVSPDGRLAISTWNVDAAGIHWGVFSLDLAEGVHLIRDHPLPYGYWDIAFIPPRTEEVLGDANADGVRDIADVVTYINHFNDDPDVGGPTDPTINGPVPRARADANQDGDIDQDDLEWLVNFLLEDQGE